MIINQYKYDTKYTNWYILCFSFAYSNNHTMKAIQFSEYGGYDQLKIVDREMPVLKEGQLLVKVTYAAVNPVDDTIRKGDIKLPTPKILGNEGAGVIIKGNDEFSEGTRVIVSVIDNEGKIRGVASEGAWQEYLAVYPSEVIKTPDHVTDEQAASFSGGFLSAYVSLDKAEFAAGKSVLSLAVGGGVGNAGSQLAKVLGASLVITTAGSAAKAEVAAKAGFENIIDLSKESISKGVARLTDGKGVDIVIDMLGGNITGDALSALAKFGILVSLGYSAGMEFKAKITDFVWKAIQMRGVSLSNWGTLQDYQRALGVLLLLLEEGKIKPTVAKVFPFEQAGEANRFLIEERPFGKVLLKF